MKRAMCLILLPLLLMLGGCGEGPAEPNSANTVATGHSMVYYYRDDGGYTVPVKRPVWMQPTPEEAIYAQRAVAANIAPAIGYGLQPLLPADLKVDVSVAEGLATVNLLEGCLFRDAQLEKQALECMVNTLCDLEGIHSVQFVQNNGETVMPQGTDISQPMQARVGDYGNGAANGTLLYYVSAPSGMLVPVKEDAQGLGQSIQTMLAPPQDIQLSSMFPPDTSLLTLRQVDEKVQLNFSREFSLIAEHPELEERALLALIDVCERTTGCDTVEIYVDGERYDAEVLQRESVEAPVFNVLEG